MLTMAHANLVSVIGDRLRVDRKFHLGMQRWLGQIRRPIVSINPAADPSEPIMDAIEVPLRELGYEVMPIRTDRHNRPLGPERKRLRAQLARSRLLYAGALHTPRVARAVGVPYILLIEYDLSTQLVMSQSGVQNVARRGIRAARCTARYAWSAVTDVRRAESLHCNGYPIYDETARFNPNRLLFLDSRMSSDLVIDEARLAERLAARHDRPLRLLFSGRYEEVKGADDAVRVALQCLRRGLPVEMHCYGQGRLADEMRALATGATGGRIVVHDAIPYPELVERSKSFDLFVCCHNQSDPSCTYLEAFGAGLPVVGYGNRMWHRLSQESQVGCTAAIGDVDAVAAEIARLSRNAATLDAMSQRARIFALAHSFENEFTRRSDAIEEALARAASATPGQTVTLD